jgi:signal transduction histidine kinase/ActR/RegA family two-component response regulator
MAINLLDFELDRLYPAYLRVDIDNNILSVGPSLERLLGPEIVGKDVFDTFDFKRPSRLTTISAISNTRQELLIKSKQDPGVLLRGIGLVREDQVLLLVGHVMGDHDETLAGKLDFSDFSPTDSTLDLLLVREINQNLLSEAKAISKELDKKRAAAESANKAKSDFLATVSHEIRTPLNGVLGMAHYLAETDLDPEQQNALRILSNSGEGLLALLNEVLDLSKIEAGKSELLNEDFDLADLVHGAAELFEMKAREQGLYCSVSTAGGQFHGDAGRLRQVLSNLVFNAIKFTQSGGVSIQVTVDQEEDPSLRLIQFVVTDTGIGMDKATIDGLFDAFYQGDSSVTQRYGGTGLGLAISRHLVGMMGGEISASSGPGEGSVFTFSVRLPIAHKKVPAVKPANNTLQSANLSALKILAAEDNKTNQFVLRNYLKRLGLQATIADNGQDVVTLWRKGEFDLILMDIRMPGMGGEEATAQIRGYEATEQRSRTPIIALTANMMREQVSEYLRVGMDDALAKPIDIAALELILRRVASGGFFDPRDFES